MTASPEAITAAGNAMRQRWLRDHYPATLYLDPMDWAATALEAAAPLIAATERERILKIARDYRAVIPADEPEGAFASFADLIATYHPGPTP